MREGPSKPPGGIFRFFQRIFQLLEEFSLRRGVGMVRGLFLEELGGPKREKVNKQKGKNEKKKDFFFCSFLLDM